MSRRISKQSETEVVLRAGFVFFFSPSLTQIGGIAHSSQYMRELINQHSL
jgi:hypothetical protein